jgi:hypothetical protein
MKFKLIIKRGSRMGGNLREPLKDEGNMIFIGVHLSGKPLKNEYAMVFKLTLAEIVGLEPGQEKEISRW